MLVCLPLIFQSLPDVPDTEKLINKECRILNQEQKHFDSRNSVCEILRFRERIAFQGSTTNEVRVISFCGAYGLQAVVRASLEPTLLRRNIMVSGINLAALKYQTFQIGTAVLRGTGNCPPVFQNGGKPRCRRLCSHAESRGNHGDCCNGRCCSSWRYRRCTAREHG